MIKTLKVFALLMPFFVTSAFAAQQELPRAERHSLESGNYALQFRISNNFVLSSFRGSLISFKYHHSDASAIRFDLSLNGRLSDRDTEIKREMAESVSEDDRSSTFRYFDISLRTQLQKYLHINQLIKPYFNYGILTGYSWFSENSDRQDQSDNSVTFIGEEEVTGQAYQIGGTGNFGLEWFATSSISILAEYGIDIYYSYTRAEEFRQSFNSESDPVDTIDRVTTSSDFMVNPLNVRFGLSAYF